MVGREAPLDTLRSLLQVVRAGRGRVAFLVGEPGLGKSRLRTEFRRWAEGEDPDAKTDGAGTPPATWIEGHCVSYGRNLPYHLLIDLVRSTLHISFIAGDAEARAQLDSELAGLIGEESADVAAYLAHLLSLPLKPDEAERAQADPDVMQGRYVAAIVRLLRALSTKSPAIVVCEDVHWADPASIDVIRNVLPLAALFVRTAAEFRSAIRVRNATRGGAGVNAKGILGILTIGVSSGHEIEISAQGEEQDAAVVSRVALVEGGWGEAPAD
jgi:phosphotransferase system HPr (HPr) family protein